MASPWSHLIAALMLYLVSGSNIAEGQSQTVLFLGEGEPLVIAFELSAEGTPFTEVWKAGLEGIVRELDRDKNGKLSRAETEGSTGEKGEKKTEPSPAANAFLQTANLWDADAEPKDDELTLAELAKFLSKNGQGAFQAEASKTTDAILSPQRLQAGNSGNSLWNRLDQDSDGNLSSAELRWAGITLKKYDLDSDESISLNELEGSTNPFFSARLSNQTMETPFFAASRGQSSTKLVRKLIAQYGTLKQNPASAEKVKEPPKSSGEKPKAESTRQEATRAETKEAANRTRPHGVKLDVLKIPKSQWAEFDRDGDGLLDLWELRAYLKTPVPAVTVKISLPKSDSSEPVLSGSVRNAKSRIVVKKSAGGAVSVLAGKIQIEVDTGGLQPEVLLDSLEERFKRADRDNNGYLEKDEANRDQFFRDYMQKYDADENEKLYPEEWRPPVEAAIRFARTQTRMFVQDAGQDVFSVLDGDRSLKISPREWLDAADRLSVWDKNGNGSLEKGEVPHVYRVSFGPGLPNLPGLITPQSNQQTATVQQLVRGPKWFRAMDKNQDGDVSAEEFLGRQEVFQQIDLDGDKLIDPREATKFKQ